MVTTATTVRAADDRPAPRPWPALRDDLHLEPAGDDPRGHPRWTLHDPVRHRFVRIDRLALEVMRRWWMADATAIASDIAADTTLRPRPTEVEAVVAALEREGLTRRVAAATVDDAPGAAWRRRAGWLLHHYLFFRVPLWHPDPWLRRALPAVRPLGGRAFGLATLAALAAGLWGLASQGTELRDLQAQWLDLLSWRGLLLYAATLVAVKLLHELGHAFTARHHGCRVPTLGVAFMLLWPMAYTDTTEAWRLADPRARRRIAAAGVRVELTLAAWATLAWVLLPDGGLRTAAFLVATTTWVSSLLVNLCPFLRFDGYYLLCDALDLPNLHERSFAQARAWLRRTLLGWDDPPAERFAPAWRRGLVVFALATWAWRLALYLAIAWTVYAIGFKLLGIALLVVELGWFIARPVASELTAWREGWPHWRHARRARASLVAGLGMVAVAAVPFAPSATAGAMLQPQRTLAVSWPEAAVLAAAPPAPGQAIAAGAVLLAGTSPAAERDAALTAARLDRLDRELAAAALGGGEQARWASLQAERDTARRELAALDEARARLRAVAPFDGVVMAVAPGLADGAITPPAGQRLLLFAEPGRWTAVAWVDEPTAAALRPGQPARLVVDARPFTSLAARVAGVAPQPVTLLPDPLLARAHGGPVEARETSAGWATAQPWYRVDLTIDDDPALPARVWRGHVRLEGERASLLARAARRLEALWVREAGF